MQVEQAKGVLRPRRDQGGVAAECRQKEGAQRRLAGSGAHSRVGTVFEQPAGGSEPLDERPSVFTADVPVEDRDGVDVRRPDLAKARSRRVYGCRVEWIGGVHVVARLLAKAEPVVHGPP